MTATIHSNSEFCPGKLGNFFLKHINSKFKEKAQQSRDGEIKAEEKQRQLQEQATMLDLAQRQATLDLTNIQSKNAIQDNTKQLMVALDKSYQEWAKLHIQAAKEGVELPKQPDITQLLAMAKQTLESDINVDASRPQGGAPMPQPQGPAAAPEQPQM